MSTVPPWLALLLTGCVTRFLPFQDDFSDEPPARALALTIDRLEQAYSFTRHKGLDWDAIHADLDRQLDETSDPDLVFRSLAASIPDGHVSLWSDEPSRDLCPEAAGDLGLAFGLTDTGLVVVTAVAPDGPADAAGIAAGDLLQTHDGRPPAEALAAAPLHCSPLGLATPARRRSVAVRLLSRAEADREIALEFSRDNTVYEAILEAEPDRRSPDRVLGLRPAQERIQSRMWAPGVGYLAVGWEDTVLSERGVRRELRALHADGARRLVLDLRNNDGGTDQTAANIVGSFTDREWFYETITMYDRRTERQGVVSEVWVEPQELRWDLPVVVLINGNTVSSGEGMAMMLRRFPGVEVVGFEGTAASFGSAGSTTLLPGGWTLSWPAGRSLDREGRIQLDSDHTGAGGVQPTLRVPATVEHLIAQEEDPVGFLVDEALRITGGAP